jgi:NAD(P)H-hydrate epimerase
MTHLEQECEAVGITTDKLMANAGLMIAKTVRQFIPKGRVLFIIGPGNNGGDGLVAARHLHMWDFKVCVYTVGRIQTRDKRLAEAIKVGVEHVEAEQDKGLVFLTKFVKEANVLVDAILGTGTSRPLDGVFVDVLKIVGKNRIYNPKLKIFAVDLPSGLNADTGKADPATLLADYTITLGLPKIGLYNSDGISYRGEVVNADIGIPSRFTNEIKVELLTEKWAINVIPNRPYQANKGTFGRVLVAGGSVNFVGAVYLAACSALRSGAGLVTLAIPKSLEIMLLPLITEATYLPLPEGVPGVVSPEAYEIIRPVFDEYDVLLLGCGLGRSLYARRFVEKLLLRNKIPSKIIIDADGLNNISHLKDWWQHFDQAAILTPHPGEMARLTNLSTEEVQQDRIGIAKIMSKKWNKIVVLKGASTVIAAPDGRIRISSLNNPALASAGTGDVLAGIIGGLLAQHLDPFEAACLGVFLHAETGKNVSAQLGESGLIASDLLPKIPLVMKRLRKSGINQSK